MGLVLEGEMAQKRIHYYYYYHILIERQGYSSLTCLPMKINVASGNEDIPINLLAPAHVHYKRLSTGDTNNLLMTLLECQIFPNTFLFVFLSCFKLDH